MENCASGFCLRVAEGITDYGYILHHSFAWTNFDTNLTIRACKVEWSAAGVTLVEPTGQRMFVPLAIYERGR